MLGSWKLGSIPSARRAAALVACVLALAVSPRSATATIVALSNTPLTREEAFTFFDRAAGVLTTADGNAFDVHVNSRVWAGKAGTPGEGLFLYDYFVEDAGGGDDLRAFEAPTALRVDFDFDDDGMPESSAYCSDCTTLPVPTPASEAFQIDTGVVWFFPSGIADFAPQLYFVSPNPPRIVMGHIEVAGSIVVDLEVLPEPESAAIAGFAGLLAIALGRRGIRPRATHARANSAAAAAAPAPDSGIRVTCASNPAG